MNHELHIDNLDLDWIAGQQPQRITSDPFVAGDPFARERARQALVRHMESGPGPRASGLRRLFGLRTLALAAAAGAAALLVVAILSSGGAPTHSGGGPAGGTPHIAPAAGHGAGRPLMRLADYVSEAPAPTGDATVIRRTTHTGGETWTGFDLYGDDGSYYYSETRKGLAGEVERGEEEGGGMFARELEVAEEAETGDVQKAAEDMANAPNPKRFHYTPTDPEYDNNVWESSQQAIIAGAGRPQIRAGVLKILGTLPGITVTEGVESGTPTLVLIGGTPEFGAEYTEQLTIDAETGVPIAFTGGPIGGPPGTRVEYQVSRADYPGLSSADGAGE